MKDIEDSKDVRVAEHDEEIPAEIASALKVGAKGGTKSADVAMKLFANHDFNMKVDPEEEKQIVRKHDWIIIPMITVNYIFFYVSPSQFYAWQYLIFPDRQNYTFLCGTLRHEQGSRSFWFSVQLAE